MVSTSFPTFPHLEESLNTRGYALLPRLLNEQTCAELRHLYNQPALYRNVINMERYRFGRGKYKYFTYPLPAVVQSLREQLYPLLAPVANRWMEVLGEPVRFPAQHAAFIAQCHEQKQTRPTPLILRYEQGGFNTLHQDLYGSVYFPFQVAFALSQYQHDYEGGEWVLTEQVPRAQSKAEVIIPALGDALVFTTHFRPVKGTRGYYRAHVKHGVSEVRKGERYALGIIFHDAA